MVGDVGDRPVAVADPEAERPPAGVRDLANQHREFFDLQRSLVEGLERPLTVELTGIDRKERWSHQPVERVGGVPVSDRQVDVDAGVGPVTGREERDPLGVVPVQVAEQQGAFERSIVEQLSDPPQPGPAVEQQSRRRLAVDGQRRRTTCALRRGRTPDRVPGSNRARRTGAGASPVPIRSGRASSS